jgi:hypothetical protein
MAIREAVTISQIFPNRDFSLSFLYISIILPKESAKLAMSEGRSAPQFYVLMSFKRRVRTLHGA